MGLSFTNKVLFAWLLCFAVLARAQDLTISGLLVETPSCAVSEEFFLIYGLVYCRVYAHYPTAAMFPQDGSKPYLSDRRGSAQLVRLHQPHPPHGLVKLCSVVVRDTRSNAYVPMAELPLFLVWNRTYSPKWYEQSPRACSTSSVKAFPKSHNK